MRTPGGERVVTVRFDAPLASEFVLVLDASAMAQKAMCTWTDSFLSACLARVRGIVFLGSAARYDPFQWGTHSPSWFRQHADRVRLVAPALDAVAGTPGTIVIVSDEEPLDLRDFEGDATWARLRRVGTATTPAEVAGREDDRAISVRIEGDGFLPLHVKALDRGTVFEVDERDGAIVLTATRFGPRVEVTVRAVVASGLPRLVVERAGGRRDTVQGQENDAPFAEARWQPLPDAVARLFREAVTTGTYTCPHCQRPHPVYLADCPRAFNVFPGLPRQVTVLLKLDDSPVFLSLADHAAFRVTESVAAARDGRILRKAGTAWRVDREIRGLPEVGGGLHAWVGRAG